MLLGSSPSSRKIDKECPSHCLNSGKNCRQGFGNIDSGPSRQDQRMAPALHVEGCPLWGGGGTSAGGTIHGKIEVSGSLAS